ncbi:MAG: MlaD family protein [Thermodesulfobacteriota bacterium]|nr:MlaD family protein [Thermodesulfobacteriota bacterium]
MKGIRAVLAGLICSGMLIVSGCSSLHYNIVFQDINGLVKGDAVCFEKNRIGRVDNILYREKGDYKVSIEIEKEFSAAVTEDSKFYIGTSPLDSNKKAVVLILLEKGGAPLESGAEIQGSASSFPADLQPFLDKLESGLDKFFTDLKSIPESEEFKELENQLDMMVDNIKEKGAAAKEKFNTETLPRLKQELETLRKKLEGLGREEELKPLERKLNNLENV